MHSCEGRSLAVFPFAEAAQKRNPKRERASGDALLTMFALRLRSQVHGSEEVCAGRFWIADIANTAKIARKERLLAFRV